MLFLMIGTVVNFCTNEARFIRACLEEALLFSDEVVAVAATHFFDGSEENRQLLEKIYSSFPQVQFIEYPFIPEAVPKRIFQTVRKENFWHGLSRWLGFTALSSRIKWALFLDADEVADGMRFAAFLKNEELADAMKFANYWYFREPIYQAKTFEDSILLVRKEKVKPELVIHSHERDALFEHLIGPKKRGVLGGDGLPMFHHFSWVRSEQEMLCKVKSWGHKGDRRWEELVREEFQSPFKGIDFVHGYEFQTVSSPFVLEASFDENQEKRVERIGISEMISLLKSLPLGKRGFWHRLGDLKERWLSG